MKKKHVLIVIALMVCLLTITGSTIFAVSMVQASKENKEETISYDTFAAWTDIEEFQTVPAFTGENIKIGEAENYGGSNNMIDVNGTTVEDYKAYLATLEAAGFKKHSDNGEDGMEGYAYTAAFTKDELTVVVSHLIKGNKTYISAMADVELSDRMIYKEEYMEGVSADAKTKLHLLELNNNGACIIIQLKNGNFVIHDGGTSNDAPYLLDYLEELTPGDAIPIVEGWFISHPHGDHYGALQTIANKTAYLKRIYVNEIYYHAPPEAMIAKEDGIASTSQLLTKIHGLFKDENGETAKGFNPQIGQRFYFCDIMVDVSMTTDQLTDTDANWDVNDTSTWFMTHIDGQRILIAGDSYHAGIRTAMNLLDKDYFEVEVYVVVHHGINVYDYFTDYLTPTTVLYPSFNVGSLYTNKYPHFARIEENQNLQAKAKEVYAVNAGTVILTFPYTVGTVEKTEPCDWRYNGGIPKARYNTNWGWGYEGE